MVDHLDDPLWPHFQPLWADLQYTQGEQIFLAGGYGLFLKQVWATQTGTPTVIPLDRWRDVKPRVTNDLDLVISIELIADPTNHQNILAAFGQNDFHVTEKLLGKRWQFKKQISEGQDVLVELHTPLPDQHRPDIRVEEIRVKHHPPLGDAGIHARRNPEAIGCTVLPTRLDLNGQMISILNPVTLCIMKLTAMRDRWEASQDQSKEQRFREFSQLQATKHAQDVCRVIALVTEEERDAANQVVGELRHQPPFQSAASILDSHFHSDQNPAVTSARNNWELEDIAQIDAILNNWFK